MEVTIQFHDGNEHTYKEVNRIAEKEHSIYVYGDGNQILAILQKFDIKNLLTKNTN